MSGLGTKESDIIRVLANRTPKQREMLRNRFLQTYGKQKNSLEKWIKDDTSGDFEAVLLAMLRPSAERDGRQLREAMYRLDTNDDELIDIITTRSYKELKDIEIFYQQKYSRTLQQDIIGDTSFRYKHTLLACVNRERNLAERLNKAFHHPLGEDDDRIMRILLGLPRDNSIYREMVEEIEDPFNIGLNEQMRHECYMPDIQDLKKAYQQMYGISIEQEVKNNSNMGFIKNFRDMCLLVLESPYKSDAKALNDAMNRAGTNDNMLIELVTARTNRQLSKISEAYKEMYGNTLIQDIKDDTSGDYQKALIRLVTPRHVTLANIVFESIKGLGTEDDRLVCALTGKSRYEILMMAKAYRKIYKKHMLEDVRSDTSFWYKKSNKRYCTSLLELCFN